MHDSCTRIFTSIVITQCLTAVRNDDGFYTRNVTVLRVPFFPFIPFAFALMLRLFYYFGSVYRATEMCVDLNLDFYQFQRDTLLYNVKCRHMSSVESLNFLMPQSSGQFGRLCSVYITSSLMLSFGLFSICNRKFYYYI